MSVSWSTIPKDGADHFDRRAWDAKKSVVTTSGYGVALLVPRQNR